MIDAFSPPGLWITKYCESRLAGRSLAGAGVLSCTVHRSTAATSVAFGMNRSAPGCSSQLLLSDATTASASTADPSQNVAFWRSVTRQVSGSTFEMAEASHG